MSSAGRERIEAGIRRVAEAGDDVVAQAMAALRWAGREYGSGLVVASSMGDLVLVHLASTLVPGVDVLFLDTGLHFAETLATRDAVGAAYDVRVVTIEPLATCAEQEQQHGADLWTRDPDACCALRKVEPVDRGLEPYDAWVSGVRRADTPTRVSVPVVGWDERRQMAKINPLAGWTRADVETYTHLHGVLRNPLRLQGYASIGCAPCTRPVDPDEDARAGRWSGHAKTECGLHV